MQRDSQLGCRESVQRVQCWEERDGKNNAVLQGVSGEVRMREADTHRLPCLQRTHQIQRPIICCEKDNPLEH